MKSYKIKMLSTSKADLTDIIDYLLQFYANTALKQYDKIIEKINTLKEFPFMCEEYQINVMDLQYRKMVIDNYLVFYIVYDDIVEIHRIINTRMDITKIIK